MRKIKEIRITTGTPETNRDHGRLYAIEEMSAFDAERWAADAFTALVKAGVEVPDDLSSAGIVAIAKMGLKALGGVPREDLHDLLDRMMECVTFYPDPSKRDISRCPPAAYTSDIEELSTLLLLRQETLLLHGSFLMAGVQSLAGSTMALAQN